MVSRKYLPLLATKWANLQNAYILCMKIAKSDRPSLTEIYDLFKYQPLFEVYNLSIHQGSALEEMQESNLGKLTPLEKKLEIFRLSESSYEIMKNKKTRRSKALFVVEL